MELDENFINNFDKEMAKPGLEIEKGKYTGNFTDMRVSDVGYGKGEYKTSKPNILKNDAVVDEILKISEAAETAIGHTIGPYADDTFIQAASDSEVSVYNTRDGYEILNNMAFTQAIPNGIFKIIRSTSEYMQDKIGDSTSSGIPIQNALLKKFIEIFNDQTKGKWTFSPVGIRHISEICAMKLIQGFTDNPLYQKRFPEPDENGKYTKEQEDEIIKWLTKVATISANNDYEMGAKIAELYRNKLDGRGHVLVCKSDTSEDYIKDSNAFVIPIGLLDNEKMCNTADGFTFDVKNPLVVMFDGRLEESDLPAFKQIVQTVIFDLKRPLFVTATAFNFHVGQFIKRCIDGTEFNELGEDLNDPKSNKEAKPFRCEIGGFILRNKETEEQYLWQDLRLMTGATSFSTELGKLEKFADDREVRKNQLEKLFGTCDQIIGSFAEVSFIGCKPNTAEFDKLITELKKRREALNSIKAKLNTHSDYTYDDVGIRIDRLQARTTFYYCGGSTKSAKKARQLVLEDATCSVATAIKNGGISIGSNMSVCHYINHNLETLVDETVDYINNIRINITAASNYDNLKNIVRVIYESIAFAFGNAYRYAMYNMYRDSIKTMDQWEKVVESEKPSVFNIMTNKVEEFNSEDADKCTTIIVPRKTDECLLRIIIENVGQLINIGNMITYVSPNLDLEEIQIARLKKA